METTPDTSQYMILGYAVFFIVSAIYIVSLYVSNRSLQRDIVTLVDLDAKN